MSDSNEPTMAFEPEDGAPDLDFQILEDGQEVPPVEPVPDPLAGKKVLSAEEYEALLKRQDSTASLSQGLGKLVETLSVPQQSHPMNAPAMAEPSEEELGKMIFEPGREVEAIRRILQKELAPVQGATIQQQMNMNKRLMKLDPTTKELFTKYEGEIERRVQGLPPQYRFRPDIYEVMYKEVIVDKQEEIIQDRAAIIAQKAVEEALTKAGIMQGQNGQAAKGPALRQEVGGVAAPRPKKQVYLTADDVRAMREMMMDPQDRDQQRAYYERFKKGKEK